MAEGNVKTSLRFKDKVVIVTGGCTGIGKGCVDVFLDNGAKVAILDIDEQTGTAISADRPEDVYYIKCDTSKEDEVKSSVGSVVDKFGKLDCLINNAGFYTPSGAVDEMVLSDFHKIMDVNFFGYFLMSKYAVVHLRKTGGSIVNIASVAGHIGYQSSLSYAATKGAILAMTKTLAIDEAKNGVRVNSVSPGIIWTQLIERYYDSLNDDNIAEKAKKMCLLNRFGKTREVGQACFYLACEGTYCTGTDLSVDAGINVGLGTRSTNTIG